MANYQDKKVVILGLGATGLSCINYFLRMGVIPKVIDTRATPPGIDKLPAHIESCFGSWNEVWLLAADLIVISPGIALAHPCLQSARDAGIEIIGDIELFCREVKAPVVAITGSNGKTTVTTLVGEMAKAAGIPVGIGGNIGVPALDLLQQDVSLYILELSSFQLETTSSLKAVAATILNVTEDHMDRYPLGLIQYQQAKQRIYHNAQCCIYNAQDKLTFPATNTQANLWSFSLDNEGKYHLANKNEHYWLAVDTSLVLSCNELNITGLHNYMNALAALALADAADIPRQASINALKQFRGLPHRCQLVFEHNGVKWINDSKATNVGSTVAALNGLVCSGTLHLLLGGDGKAADFSPLGPYVSKKNIRLYCFGQDAQQLAELCPQQATIIDSMQQAMHLIANKVKPDDIVLLSPACASLDQFRNYEQRGELFSQLAKELG